MRASGHGSTHHLSDFIRVLLRVAVSAGMNQRAVDDGQGQVPVTYLKRSPQLSKLLSYI